MIEILQELKKKVCIGFVGGSDYSKVYEQLGESTINNFLFYITH